MIREYLISLRKKQNLTQQSVAKKLLISQNYLSLIEQGSRQSDLKLSTLKSLARVYGIELSKLIEAESEYQMQIK